MTIKDTLNSLSDNLQVSKSTKKDNISSNKADASYVKSAYRLDISSTALQLLNNLGDYNFPIINEDVLSYDENLNLIKKY